MAGKQRELTREDLAQVLRAAHGARFDLVDTSTQEGLISNLATTLRAMQSLGYVILAPEDAQREGALIVGRG